MKAISRDLIYKYQPLSDIQLSKDEKKVYFVSTKTDLKNNDYKQDLRVIDTLTNKQSVVLKDMKRVRYFVLDNETLLIDPKNKKAGYTSFLRLNDKGKTVKAFELPLDVDGIKDFNRNFYLVTFPLGTADLIELFTYKFENLGQILRQGLDVQLSHKEYYLC